MANYEPPPTYAEPIVVDETSGRSRFNPIWLKWFLDLATNLTNAANPELQANKNVASGYAGLNSASRITKGVDAADDLIVDLATKGLVLKDTQGTPHYWRVTVSVVGVLTTSDLGTAKP